MGDSTPKEFRNIPDYAALDLPEDKPKSEWSWQHRRAYVYQRIMDEGHHSLLNKTDLSAKFEVTRKTIYSDIDKIAEYITDEFNPTRHKSQTVAVFEKAVRELLDEGRYKDAAKVRAQFDEWRENRGDLDKEATELDVNHSVDEDDLEFLDDVF